MKRERETQETVALLRSCAHAGAAAAPASMRSARAPARAARARIIRGALDDRSGSHTRLLLQGSAETLRHVLESRVRYC